MRSKLAEPILLDAAQIGGEGQLGDEGRIAPVGAQSERVQVGDVRCAEGRGVIAGEDVALRFGEVGVVVAQVERKGLIREANTGVPGPVALIGHATWEGAAADRRSSSGDRGGIGAIEVAAGAERPIAGVTGDQHADTARQHAARYSEGKIAGGEPAVRTGVQDRWRVPFLNTDRPLIVNRVGSLAVNFDKAQVAFDHIPVWQGKAPRVRIKTYCGPGRCAGCVYIAVEAFAARIPVVPNAEIERELTESRPHAAVEVDL